MLLCSAVGKVVSKRARALLTGVAAPVVVAVAVIVVASRPPVDSQELNPPREPRRRRQGCRNLTRDVHHDADELHELHRRVVADVVALRNCMRMLCWTTVILHFGASN
jgi:hypothetical protein